MKPHTNLPWDELTHWHPMDRAYALRAANLQPELLGALKELLDEIEEYYEGLANSNGCERARKALAKCDPKEATDADR